MSERPVLFLKRALLAFWAVWHTLVLASNGVDAGKALGLLPDSWAFASGNYPLLVRTTARYGPPSWLNGLLFVGVIVWEGAAALLFWKAWGSYRRKPTESRNALYAAFSASLLLWGAFLVADEVCIAYALAGAHLGLFTAQLATLLAIELLPNDRPTA